VEFSKDRTMRRDASTRGTQRADATAARDLAMARGPIGEARE
jgi:hypothetical protein